MHFQARRKAYIPPIQHKWMKKTIKTTIFFTIQDRARSSSQNNGSLFSFRTNYLIQIQIGMEKRGNGSN